MRLGARWALGIGAVLIAIAAVSPGGADVLPINLNECSGSCIAPEIDDTAADEDDATADIVLSLLGGNEIKNANDARSDLVLDPDTLPAILVDGFPSPILSIAAQIPESPGVSPYAFFRDLVDIPLPIDPRTGLTAASLRLFTPSMIGQITLTDVLSDSRDLFRRRPR